MKKTMAYKHKGMKAPRPGMAAPEMDQSAAPKHKPSMQHKEPSRPIKSGDQSMAPDHKKKELPMQDAPAGVSSVNGGSSMSLPKGGGVGETEV
jgi:hypothetical protein